MINKETKVTTGKVRFSYVNVWEPASINGGSEKYSVSLIIPKSDMDTIAKINAAVEAAKGEWILRYGGELPEELMLPLKDGDTFRSEDKDYENSFFITAATRIKPRIVDRDIKPVLDREGFYSGCYGRASLQFYTFNSGEYKA